jgi:hypothetical protein
VAQQTIISGGHMKSLWTIGLLGMIFTACSDSGTAASENGTSSTPLLSSSTQEQLSSTTENSSSSSAVDLSEVIGGTWYRDVQGVKYELVIGSENSYACDFDKIKNGMDVAGDFTLEGNIITMKDTHGWAMDAVEIGTYSIEYDTAQETLTFTMISDGANGRPGILVGTWKR